MRLRSALFASLLAAPCFAQGTTSGPAGSIETQLYPILWTYEACAIRHLRSAAGAFPGSEFVDHERSIKPACGGHIDEVRLRLLRLGWDPVSIEAEIRTYYATLRPKLIVVFETERLPPHAALPPRPPAPLPLPRDRDDEASSERARALLMRELGQDHRACITRVIAELVPYSGADNSETLAKAVMARCMDFEKRRVHLLQALYELPKAQAERMVEKVLEEERLRVLAAVVTFRAALARRGLEGVAADPASTGSIRQLRP